MERLNQFFSYFTRELLVQEKLGFEDIPGLMDEYNELEDIYFGKTQSR